MQTSRRGGRGGYRACDTEVFFLEKDVAAGQSAEFGAGIQWCAHDGVSDALIRLRASTNQ
jgi:hypothetical protein